MDIAIQAARQQIANERIGAAAHTLAERFGVHEQAAALRTAGHQDAALATLFKAEATANLLEGVVQATGPQVDDPISGLTVDDATTLIGSVAHAAELDTLEAAEQAGKQRKGVLAAIAARREALAAGA